MPLGRPIGLVLVIAAASAGSCSPTSADRHDPSTPAPTAGAATPALALHNVHRLEGADGRLISGAAPEGDAGFDELRAMGVRTVISVDGATPDVARAEARGMRYVHIPVTYAEVSPEQRAEIARAVRDLAGPVYIHCHHGKHRGPAAAASAAVALGYFTPAQGVVFMKTAGTAESYPGLYACVAAARPATAEQLDAASAEFPSNRRAHGLVAAMVEVDAAFEHLGDIRAAGWTVPADQPDLVPAAEAGRLADNLRYGGEDPQAQALGTDFMERLNQAIRGATALEAGLVSGASRERLEAGFRLVQGSCRGCHARYRDGAPE